MPSVNSFNSSLLIEAGETITVYSPVVVINDKAYVASSSNFTHFNKVIGIALSNGVNGKTINIQTNGTIINQAWNFTVGNVVLLGIDGALNHIPSGTFVQEMGIPLSSNKLLLNIGFASSL